nr:hypothetical protein [Rhizobium sp. 18065]
MTVRLSDPAHPVADIYRKRRHGENDQESQYADEDLPGLFLTSHMAAQVVENLGRREVLLGTLSAHEGETRLKADCRGLPW